jgi:hypothetical protein
MRAALSALAESIASLVASILGGGAAPRPPAMIESANSPANPAVEAARDLQKNSTLVTRWANACVLRGRAQVPSELPHQLQLWLGNLNRDEIETLVKAGLSGIRAHLSGAALIADVMPVGGSLKREARRQAQPELADATYLPPTYASR